MHLHEINATTRSWNHSGYESYYLEYGPPRNASSGGLTNVGENFTLSGIFCADFLAFEPPIALRRAQEQCPEHFTDPIDNSTISYTHYEYLVPPNVDNCTWGGLGSLGSYRPNGNTATPRPGGESWSKSWGVKVRAHETGHNMGMMHSSSFSHNSQGYLWRSMSGSSMVASSEFCKDIDGFVEYGDTRCVAAPPAVPPGPGAHRSQCTPCSVHRSHAARCAGRAAGASWARARSGSTRRSA